MSKIAIVYFSRKDGNYWGGSIKNLEKGNTEVVSEFVQQAVGGKLFEIVPDKEYPKDYYACCDEAKVELQERARIEPVEYMDDLEEYDIVFLGYPIWWGTIPMAVDTFLRHYDWAGKTIAPFCTNEGSGLGSSVRFIEEACPGAKVVKGLSITGSKASKSGREISDWATSIAQ